MALYEACAVQHSGLRSECGGKSVYTCTARTSGKYCTSSRSMLVLASVPFHKFRTATRCYYFLLCKKGCACMYARQLCSLQMYVLQQPVFERRRPVVLPVLLERGSSETKARVLFDTIHNKATLQLAELQVTSCAARACGPKSITTERCHLFFYLKINVKETTCSGSKLPISPLRRL